MYIVSETTGEKMQLCNATLTSAMTLQCFKESGYQIELSDIRCEKWLKHHYFFRGAVIEFRWIHTMGSTVTRTYKQCALPFDVTYKNKDVFTVTLNVTYLRYMTYYFQHYPIPRDQYFVTNILDEINNLHFTCCYDFPFATWKFLNQTFLNLWRIVF